MSEPSWITKSERFDFRLLEYSDFDDLKRLDMDPAVRAFFPGGTSTPEKIRQHIAGNRDTFESHGFGELAVIVRDTGSFAGRAGFSLMEDGEIEVGYVFLKEYWGRGFAQETLRALLAWGRRKLEAKRILAYAPTNHVASLNVMKKCGMRYLETRTRHGVECEFYEYPV